MTENGPIRGVAQETPAPAPMHLPMRLFYLLVDLIVLSTCVAGLWSPQPISILILLFLAAAVVLLCCVQVGLRVFSPAATARRAAAFSDATRESLRGLRTSLLWGGALGLCVSFIIKQATESRHNYGFIFLFCMFGVTDAISDLLGEPETTQVPRGPRQRIDYRTWEAISSSHWGEPPRSV